MMRMKVSCQIPVPRSLLEQFDEVVHSSSCSMVRTDYPYKSTTGKSKNAWKSKEYRMRTSKEWDVRIDVYEQPVHAYNVPCVCYECIVDHVKLLESEFEYVLIGGVEAPDTEWNNLDDRSVGSGSTGTHVHIAAIFKKDVDRSYVLRVLREPRALTSEYCVPRKDSYCYAGWYVHHLKEGWKLNPTERKLYEHGDLPMDAYTEKKCEQVIRMVSKYGNEDDKAKFASYYLHLSSLNK